MALLIGSDFHSDPRIRKAKQQILLVLKEYQRKIKKVTPPNPNLIESYENLIKEYDSIRVGNLFFPYIGTGMGNGPLVELADGSVKYDMITGIGVHVFGHSYPPLVEASLDAALGDTIMQGNLQQNLESITLCQNLLQSANKQGAGLDRCFISTSGAMANENAFKLLFHKQYPRTRILAFHGCFMGRTLTLAAVTDKPAYRKNMPVWPQVDYIPFFDIQDPEGSEARALEMLKKHITDHPGEHAFMTMELILGEAGSYVGNKEFFKKIISVLQANDIAIMVDEIQTFGRTHEMFAFQLFDLNEEVDVVTVGKLSQVCATLFRESLKPPPGLISQTFTGSTASIMAANVILESIEKDGFLGVAGKNNHVGNSFREFFRDLSDRYPESIQGPFGLGAMVAFTAFQGDPEKNKAFILKLFANGLIAFLAGSDPVRIRFLPPIGVMEDSHIDDVCTILEATLEEMLAL